MAKNNDYSWNSFWLMFGSFVDEFYEKKDEQMLEREPIYNDFLSMEIKAFIAASVDYLCGKYNFQTTSWSKKECFVLKEPFFQVVLKAQLRL